MESDKIRYLISECDKEILRLDKELLDVLTDMETPINSGDEGEEVEEEDGMREVKSALLRVEALPNRETFYSSLYNNEEYCEKSKRKVRKMKKQLKGVRLISVLTHPEFIGALRRVERVYPDDGGRQYINTLMACHHILSPEN